jgi:hypothetical protein
LDNAKYQATESTSADFYALAILALTWRLGGFSFI